MVAAALDLIGAVVLCLMVCAIAGAIAVVCAWLHGAAAASLLWWFTGGCLFALLSIAALFLWDQRL